MRRTPPKMVKEEYWMHCTRQIISKRGYHYFDDLREHSLKRLGRSGIEVALYDRRQYASPPQKHRRIAFQCMLRNYRLRGTWSTKTQILNRITEIFKSDDWDDI